MDEDPESEDWSDDSSEEEMSASPEQRAEKIWLAKRVKELSREGLSTQYIAQRLGVSTKTVSTYRDKRRKRAYPA